jgi:50S ribosomal subunit-associated GTPase HflX
MGLSEIVMEGTLKPDGTLELDGKPNLAPGRVQVMLAPLPELPADDPFWQRMRAIWEGQKARGFVPRTADEVEAERRQVREEWEERMRCIERTRAEAESLRTARERGA